MLVTEETLRVARLNRPAEAFGDGEGGHGRSSRGADARFECALAETLGFVTLDDVVLRDAVQGRAGGETTSPLRAHSVPRYRALRVASDGWELHVLKGAREWFETAPPDLVLVEVTFARLFAAFEDDAGAAAREAADTFAWLASLGYEEAAHAGEACDARRRGAPKRKTADANAANAETETSETFGGWCAFEPADVPFVARAACPERPESVLLRLSRSA